jgi:hypothetical protein
MKTLIYKYPGIYFTLKCALAGGFIMFICMVAGGLIVNPNLFNNFLLRPQIWHLVFLETAIWLIPFMLFILPIFNRLSKASEKTAKKIVIIGWVTVGVLVALAYKLTYYSSDWSLKLLLRSDIIFGWSIPYTFILVTFVIFSLQYINDLRNPKY